MTWILKYMSRTNWTEVEMIFWNHSKENTMKENMREMKHKTDILKTEQYFDGKVIQS